MIRTAINHFHKQANEIKWTNYEENTNIDIMNEDAEDQISDMSPDEVLKLAQQLPPAYRMAINLFAVEGYSHQDRYFEIKSIESKSTTQISYFAM